MENYVEILGNYADYADYAEKTPDCAEKLLPWLFQRIKYMYTLTFYQEFQSLISCLTFAAVCGAKKVEEPLYTITLV